MHHTKKGELLLAMYGVWHSDNFESGLEALNVLVPTIAITTITTSVDHTTSAMWT